VGVLSVLPTRYRETVSKLNFSFIPGFSLGFPGFSLGLEFGHFKVKYQQK